MESWINPPNLPAAKDVMDIEDPVERADVAHRALRTVEGFRTWLVRARGEAIAGAYARGTPYAALGVRWGVSGERVRQMMFQVDEKRSGWCAGQDVRPRRTTPRPLPFGLLHAMRAYDDHAACGYRPVRSLGTDFTGTVYPTCGDCREVVREDLGAPGP